MEPPCSGSDPLLPPPEGSPVSLSYGKQGDPPLPVSLSTELGEEGPEVCSQGPGCPSINVPSLSLGAPPPPSRSVHEQQKSVPLCTQAPDPLGLSPSRAKTVDPSQMGPGTRPRAEPVTSAGGRRILPGSKENPDVRTSRACSR